MNDDVAEEGGPSGEARRWLDVAALTDVGTARDHNEDHCGVLCEGPSRVVAAVADGVSGAEGGEEASQRAIETILASFADQGLEVPPAKRLLRAVQQANIEIYDRALVVPELRGMATTLTALVVDEGELGAVHVGDSRLYLLRGATLTQLTKDHTVAANSSTLTRSLGRELIAAVDRIATRVYRDDVLIVCSDGLYNVLADEEMRRLVDGVDAARACRALIDAANACGTDDNLTAAVVRVLAPAPVRPERSGAGSRLARLFGRGRP